VPQARPNVPESENQDPRGIGGRGNEQDGLPDSWAPESDKVRILSNDNNGNFLLEENLNNNGEIPFKRNFIPESKQPPTVRPSKPATTLNTVSPALTKKPRTWPSSLKKSTVSVMERSKNGEMTPEVDDKRIFESTTFSTSEVHVSASTTAAPRSLEQMIRMMEQKMLEEKEKLREANVDQGLKIAKGEKLLTAIRAKVAAREQTDDEDMTGKNWEESPMATNRDKSPNSLDLQSASSDLELGTSGNEKKKGRFKNEEKAIEARKMARLRARRRKLTQRAKALAKALGDITEDEPYVVFPMDNVNTKEKSVDEIFGSNPGLKRISAYDFEAAMAEKEEQATEATLPISELKSSIDGLADTMSKLSSTVHETTTKKDTASEDKISQLQEEIAKLTETLASLKIAPANLQTPTLAPTTLPTQTMNSLNVVSSTTRRIRRPTTPAERDNISFEPAGSEVDLTSWGNLAGERRNEPEQKLEIVEVFTVPSTTEQARQRVRTTFRPRAPTLAPLGRPISSTTHRSSPFQESMENLLEMSSKKHPPTNRDDISTFFGSASEDDFGKSAPAGDTFLGGRDSINQQSAEQDSSPTSVLGLFEKMRRMHAQAKENFEVVELPTQEQEEERFQQLQEQLRQRQMDRLRAEEEDLREQQRKKLEMFQLLQEEEQEALQQENEMEDMKRQLLQEQQQKQNFVGTSWGNSNVGPKKSESPGVAFASITIENVDTSAHDYEVTDNGIVRLRRPQQSAVSPEYEYEYYEADPDDIQFPVGGTKQFYDQKRPTPEADPISDPTNQLSNKALLMNLLQASNNFQNREFLDRLRTIVSGVESESELMESITPLPKLRGTDTGQGQGAVSLLSKPVEGWTPNLPPLHTKAPRLTNTVNSLPVWPSSSNGGLANNDQFQPLRSPVRFPNRRMDSGLGEVSLVTGDERRKATSLTSFGMKPTGQDSSYSSYNRAGGGHSRLSEVLDTTSDQEFLVSSSMAMQGGSQALPPPGSGHGSVTVFDTGTNIDTNNNQFQRVSATRDGLSYSSFGGGFNAGTATPVHGAEVFRLGSGVQLQQQQERTQVAAGANYILPTYSSNRQQAEQRGEIYSDIRMEARKKNLLTLPTNPNKLYIKSAQAEPSAEVILYPAGQLLSNSQPRAAHGLDPMIMSGSAEKTLMTQDARGGRPDPGQTYHLTDEMAAVLDRDTEMFDPAEEGNGGEPPPKGLLETLIRSAKDDLKFGGQVISFLQENGR